MYFVHRLAGDKQSTGDVKAIEKGRLLLESDWVLATSYLMQGNALFFTGIVGAAMKARVTYNFKLKLDKYSGDIVNSHYECPAGRGPHGTCKHLAAVALLLLTFAEGKGLYIKRSCTENLQTFHKPKHSYSGKNLFCKIVFCFLSENETFSVFDQCCSCTDHSGNDVNSYTCIYMYVTEYCHSNIDKVFNNKL
ncbi:uncharacterized protein LOC111116693 isoform X1 [Crassostrea virginica]